jgi:hypothetical protein
LKLHRLLFTFVLAGTALAATDPFIGTWVYNAQKSPKPTITYEIKDLGGHRYALTGSTGTTTEIKADGVPIKTASGATVSFKKLDNHTWQMDRTEGATMARTYTVSADDKSLVLHDIFTAPDGGKEETTTTYSRTSPGKSIFGEWKSISMEEKTSGKPAVFVIQPYGKDGLTFISESEKRRTDMNFDGKQYVETGPDGKTGDSSSGKRVSANVIQMESQSKGKPEDNEELKVSDDGKTLTFTSTSLKTSAVFTSVWDKQ